VADPKIVLGIDPGTIVTGFGVVSREAGRMQAVGWSSVRTSPKATLSERLRRIHEAVVRQIEVHRPDEVAVENLFQARNVKSALLLGHARGVALLAAAEAGVRIFEYAPREVKLSVVGNGSASKVQVAAMVARLLGIDAAEMLEDESDAMAVAICHLHKTSKVRVGR
jgi:crossover junction endodeoxyribonuclease RuvC